MDYTTFFLGVGAGLAIAFVIMDLDRMLSNLNRIRNFVQLPVSGWIAAIIYSEPVWYVIDRLPKRQPKEVESGGRRRRRRTV